MSKIQWTDKTSNPIHLLKDDGSNGGHWCQKISEGCASCYAEAQNQKGFFPWASKLKYSGSAPNLILDDSILNQWQNGNKRKNFKPKKIFVCSMTDLFGDWIPFEWQKQIFDSMLSSKHIFQILTKRPENLYQFLLQYADLQSRKFMQNVWLGTSIESQKYVDRIIPLVQSHLHSIKGNVRFLSIEPLLE
jgi:protein gp37